MPLSCSKCGWRLLCTLIHGTGTWGFQCWDTHGWEEWVDAQAQFEPMFLLHKALVRSIACDWSPPQHEHFFEIPVVTANPYNQMVNDMTA